MLLEESRKSNKKSPGKPEKIQKIWPETGKYHFGVTERCKKFYGKPEKAYFFCGKPETDPLFPALFLKCT